MTDAAPLPDPDATPPAAPPAAAPSDEGRNPAQQRIVALLGAAREARPDFPVDLGDRIRAELEHRLAPVVAAIPEEGGTLWVSKHDLTAVHGCEGRFLADRDAPFSWTVQSARGSVAHKAIELSLAWRGTPTPLDLVDEAVARLESGDRSLADFLQRCTEADLAELRAEANERVAAFFDLFPPLKRSWVPVVEARLRADLCHDRLVLSGKIDLALGRAQGLTAGKVIVDFKTGGPSLAHRDDLRFYALLETMRVGVPPRRLATVYLESGRVEADDVSEELLDATVRRVADGIERLADLARAPDDAVLRPGRGCRWCPRRADCATGQRWLVDNDLDDGDAEPLGAADRLDLVDDL